ncbi:Uu.00g080020.m01.CDS01 [Anthostomella pinea]|uniref:Uu.00g080020.m01.CDS01 n=1 Tax=Anthostomella pinea TaxID=933095 RepID=A0AAI8VKX2_9PEZI|nr:Uu.00g080020.m01.CDS01 [Anthostomella pinea]
MGLVVDPPIAQGDTLRYITRGVAVHVMNLISKVPENTDASEVPGLGHRYQPATEYFVNRPELHEYRREMH